MPKWVILHYTAMNSAAEAIERLCDTVHQVSAHYVISESGTVTQLVSDDMRAWHAGQSFWQGCRDVNSASIVALYPIEKLPCWALLPELTHCLIVSTVILIGSDWVSRP